MNEKAIEIGLHNGPPNPSEGFFLASMEQNIETPMTQKHLMNESQMDEALLKMARQIVKQNKNMDDVVLIGIRSRGVPLAHWLARKIEQVTKRPIPVGSLDINLYRDDLSEVDSQPVVRKTELPFAVGGKGVILVDDVLYTGRTIRSALDALVDFGRPKFVQLAVMVDRGWRELPIQGDYVAKKVKTTANENVKVLLSEMDGSNQVYVKNNSKGS